MQNIYKQLAPFLSYFLSFYYMTVFAELVLTLSCLQTKCAHFAAVFYFFLVSNRINRQV